MGKKIDELNYHIEWLEPSELIAYANNAKLHDEKNIANIANSIKRYGWQQNLTITKDKVIIIGHGRQLAAMRLGIKVPCKVIEDDLSEDDIRELRIADNLTHDGQYDWEQMNEEINQFGLEFEGFDFNFDEQMQALAEEEAGEAIEDDYDEELPEEPRVKPGDVWLVGRHRLCVGDSTSIDDVEKLMDGAKADMLLTDPPYNVAYEGKTKDALKIENDKMADAQFRQFLVDAYTNADLVMKPGAVFYIWYANLQAYNFIGAMQDMGWKMRQNLIWNKNVFAMGRADYQWKHEPCIYGWKEGANHLWASDRKQTTVINWDKPVRNDIHPTMKPIGLFDYCIKNNTKGGDIVLDLFSGSGTTIMACEQNGRTGYAMEFDPKYAEASLKRYVQFTGKADEVFLLRDGEKIPYSEMFVEE